MTGGRVEGEEAWKKLKRQEEICITQTRMASTKSNNKVE
jgi:hypothetical protein